MEIKPLSIDDYPQLIALWEQVGFKLSRADERENLERFLNRNPDLCLGMTENDQIIGTILGCDDGRRGYIYHLAIDPQNQHQGIGTQLFQELIRRFRDHGLQKVHGFVVKENAGVAKFYESLGAVKREDIFIMSLDIDPAQEPQ